MKLIPPIKYKGDWGYYSGYPGEFHYTIRHKIRIFFQIHGQMQNGSYCFGNFDKFPKKMRKPMYNIMYYVGNPILNFIIGYKKI